MFNMMSDMMYMMTFYTKQQCGILARPILNGHCKYSGPVFLCVSIHGPETFSHIPFKCLFPWSWNIKAQSLHVSLAMVIHIPIFLIQFDDGINKSVYKRIIDKHLGHQTSRTWRVKHSYLQFHMPPGIMQQKQKHPVCLALFAVLCTKKILLTLTNSTYWCIPVNPSGRIRRRVLFI